MKATAQYSITRRVITLVLLVEFVSALCVTGIALVYSRHAHFRTFQIMLRGRADTLLGAVQDAEDKQDNVMLDGTESSLPANDIYHVQDQNGRVLGHSKNWDRLTGGLDAASIAGNQTVKLGHRRYGLLVLHGLRMVDPGDQGGGIPRYVTIIYGSPTAPVWRAITGEVRFYAISSLVVMAITGLMIAWLLNRGLAPLHELASAASAVSVNSWHFETSDEVRSTRELAPLATALHTVIARLEKSFEQQRHFVGDAAHELRTAVTVVRSSIQLLALKQRTAAEYEAGLERCLNDCLRMEELVANMLTLARLENATAEPASPAQCDLSKIVQQVASELSSVAVLRGVEIAGHAPAPSVVGMDADDAHVLCSNLLLNAVQHSDAGSPVRVEVKGVDQTVELCVEDQGHGIDPEALPHIFDRFYRSDSSRTRASGGTGLGLALTKAVVERAHGTINATSVVGEGTVVRVALPLALTLPSA